MFSFRFIVVLEAKFDSLNSGAQRTWIQLIFPRFEAITDIQVSLILPVNESLDVVP